MSKLYVQQTETVLSSSAILLATGSISGSLTCEGYAKLVGIVYSSMSAAAGAGSGVNVMQSLDYGANWDALSASNPIKAVTGSTFDIPIYGNAIKVQIWNGASSASVFRTNWYLRPI